MTYTPTNLKHNYSYICLIEALRLSFEGAGFKELQELLSHKNIDMEDAFFKALLNKARAANHISIEQAVCCKVCKNPQPVYHITELGREYNMRNKPMQYDYEYVDELSGEVGIFNMWFKEDIKC